MTSGFRT